MPQNKNTLIWRYLQGTCIQRGVKLVNLLEQGSHHTLYFVAMHDFSDLRCARLSPFESIQSCVRSLLKAGEHVMGFGSCLVCTLTTDKTQVGDVLQLRVAVADVEPCSVRWWSYSVHLYDSSGKSDMKNVRDLCLVFGSLIRSVSALEGPQIVVAESTISLSI